VLLFLVAYLVYGASRWVMTGDDASALEHARSIVELEDASGVAVEESVQRALEVRPGCGCSTTPTSPPRSVLSLRR